MWIKVVDGVEVRCLKNNTSNKPFKYEMKIGEAEPQIIDSSLNSPIETTYRSTFFSEIKKHLSDFSTDKQNEIFIQIKNSLEKNIVDEDKLAEIERANEIREAEKKRDEKYTNLYARFNGFLEKYDNTEGLKLVKRY